MRKRRDTEIIQARRRGRERKVFIMDCDGAGDGGWWWMRRALRSHLRI